MILPEEDSTLSGYIDLQRSTDAARLPGEPGRRFAVSPEPLPERIGRYRVVRKLGEGGMGEVFLAYDDRLSREVALKRVLPGKALRGSVRRRFEVEARVTGILQHPSVVPVYEYFEHGEEACYTMRPIDGITLLDLIDQLRHDLRKKREEWPSARLVRLFLQAANAVAYAHSHGVIHRDLKPGNVMIGPFEQVLVLDWGTAKLLRDASGIEDADALAASDAEALGTVAAKTTTRSLIGTPYYMAPEQLRCEPATFRSDVFSLGIILYQLLTLRTPWTGGSVEELHEARRAPPPRPSELLPARSVSAEMDDVALRALRFHPGKRFASVKDFSKEVARVLEGRPLWYLERASKRSDTWSAFDLSVRQDGESLLLQSGSPSRIFRYSCSQRFPDNLRLEFEFSTSRGSHELFVRLDDVEPARPARRASDRYVSDRPSSGAYRLDVLPGRRHTLSIQRAGRVVSGAKSPPYEPRRWYHCAVVREDNRFSLKIDGEEIYVYHDPIALPCGFVSLGGRSSGLRLRGIRVSSRSASARVSCLAVPDAFFNHRLYERARTEYERIASSHPGRNEGRLAGFRGGLCLLEMAREESDTDLRRLLLEEGREIFSGLDPANKSCLSCLGLAMIADESGDWDRKFASLRAALVDYPDDPHRATVLEWLLGRLHAVDLQVDRRRIAELLPLAIKHSMDNLWSRRVLTDLVKKVRREWEFPSFMNSRSLFKERDVVAHQEARLFVAFWSARTELIGDIVTELGNAGQLRPHHLADAVGSLLELGQPRAAADLLQRIDDSGDAFLSRRDPRVENALEFASASIAATNGDFERARHHFQRVDPERSVRIYNSARRWLAQGLFESGRSDLALRVFRPLSAQDGYARERRAWIYLEMGDTREADRALAYFIRRKDHLSGRNLANFLHGVSLTLKGRGDAALDTFRRLEPTPYPRSWTLGSHFALGRLGNGQLEVYLENSFLWERVQLERQARLFAKARGAEAGGPQV